MKARIEYYKPSGKYYTEEDVELPDNTNPWDPIVRESVRIKDMIARYGEDAPWGFPILLFPTYDK